MMRLGSLKQDKSGVILITVMGTLAMLSLAVVAIFSRGLWQTTTSERLYSRSSALHLAEAAIEQSARNLKTPTSSDDITEQVLSTGSYAIDEPVLIGVNLWVVTASGTSTEGDTRQVESIIRLTQESIFQFALFGDLNLDVSGSAITDSFDSSLGPYNDDPNDPDYNKGHNGDIGTNSDQVGGVEFTGSSLFVDGQVAVGYGALDPYAVVEGYDPDFVTGGTDPPSDTQDIISQGTEFPMPSVIVPVGLTCIDHEVGSSDTEVLSPTGGENGDGVYCFNNLSLNGGATLTTTGFVTVYVTGVFTAKGNSLIGNPSDPTQLLMKMSSTGDVELEPGVLTGTTGFYGALYAPDSTINISGNAEIFGSVIAQEINVTGNAAIHYDESITEIDEVSNTFTTERLTWREI